MSLTITQGPGVLGAQNVPRPQGYSLTGLRSQNNTQIKPVLTQANTGASGNPSNVGQNNSNLSNIGMPVPRGTPANEGLSLGGAPRSVGSAGMQQGAAAASSAPTGQLQPQDYNDLTKLSDRQLYELQVYGPNVPPGTDVDAIIAAAQREAATRRPTTTGPTGNGMQSDGLQQGVTTTAPAQNPSITNPLPPSQGQGQYTGVGAGQNPTGPGTGPNVPIPNTGAGGTPPPTNGMGGDGGQISLEDLRNQNNGGQQQGGTPAGAGQPTTGNGGTTFNPGGGTNPDGTNPGVPQGNPNNGTAPNVYQLLPQGGRPAAENTRAEDGRVQGQFVGDTGRAFQSISSDAAGMGDMDVASAAGANAANTDRTASEAEMSSNQMRDILSQDGALMQLAAQDGIDIANRVGMRNSSLAAGSMQREMARAATPLALQQADVQNRTGMQNQSIESNRQQFNAGQDQQNNQFNAANENAAESQEFQSEAQRRDANAARQTQVSTANAGMANQVMESDRNREFQYNMQQLSGDQDFAKQSLAADRAIDMANIEGQYNMLISDNAAASSMVQSTYDAMADILSNPDIFGDEASEKVNFLVSNLTSMLDGLLAFEDLQIPMAGSTGSGKNSGFQSGGPTDVLNTNNPLSDFSVGGAP